MIKKIGEELIRALKDKDQATVSCLRMLKADIQNASIAKKEELKKEDVIKIIQKQVRQHKESIEQFKKGDRNDLVQKEEKELKILEAFLPKALPKEELTKIIKDVIKELGASTKKDMGKVIKEAIQRAKGRADGREVSQIAAGLL